MFKSSDTYYRKLRIYLLNYEKMNRVDLKEVKIFLKNRVTENPELKNSTFLKPIIIDFLNVIGEEKLALQIEILYHKFPPITKEETQLYQKTRKSTPIVKRPHRVTLIALIYLIGSLFDFIEFSRSLNTSDISLVSNFIFAMLGLIIVDGLWTLRPWVINLVFFHQMLNVLVTMIIIIGIFLLIKNELFSPDEVEFLKIFLFFNIGFLFFYLLVISYLLSNEHYFSYPKF